MMETKYELVAWTKNITDYENARLYVTDMEVEWLLLSPLCEEYSKCRQEKEKNGGLISVALARRYVKVYEDSARLDLFLGNIDHAIRLYLQAASFCDKLPHEFCRLCAEALDLARKYRFEHILKEEKCKAILQPYLQYNLTGRAV